MKRRQGKSVYIDEYADGTLRVTIIENIDILDNTKNNDIGSDVCAGVLSNDPIQSNDENVPSDSQENDSVFLSSVSRTRATIYDIVHNMEIEWFGTLTIAPEFHVDRNDKTAVKKYVGSWFNNIKKRYCPDLMYLAIPEPHEKGGIHFHVLLGNTGSLDFVFSGVKQKRRKVYNLLQWVAGFTNFTKVTDKQRCANYVLKYITKDLLDNEKLDFGKQRYLVSQNIPKKIQHSKFFVELDSNEQYDCNDIGFSSRNFDKNMKRSNKLVSEYGNYEFSFSKNLDLESGNFKFHSTRFFYKRKDN